MNSTRIRPYTTNQKLGYRIVVVLACAAGFAMQAVGTLYVADIFCALTFIGVALGRLERQVVPERFYALGIGLCVLAFTYFALDLYNNVPVFDYTRALARNLLFSMGFTSWIFIIFRWGIRGFTVLSTICMLSPGLLVFWGLTVNPSVAAGDFIALFKFNGGMGAILLVALFLRRNLLAFFVAMAVATLTMTYVIDFRSGAAFIAGGISMVAVSKYLKTWAAGRVAVLLALGMVCIGFGMKNLMMDERYFEQAVVERRAESNRQRAEVALFSIDELLQRPLVGYGSWQNMARYVDVDNTEAVSMVHSMFLQYGYEYGICGILYPAIMMVVLLMAIPAVIEFIRSQDWGVSFVVCFMLLSQGWNLVMGGLAGYGRIVTSAGFALSAFFAFRRLWDRQGYFRIMLGNEQRSR